MSVPDERACYPKGVRLTAPEQLVERLYPFQAARTPPVAVGGCLV